MSEEAAAQESSAPDTALADAMMAAATESLGQSAPEGGVPAGAEAGLPSTEAAADAASPTDSPKTESLDDWRKLLSEREEQQKARESAMRRAREELRAEMKAEIEAEKARAREELKREISADYARRFKETPVDAIRDIGVDGANLVADLANRASPEHAMREEIRKIREELSKANEPVRKELDELKSKYSRDEKAYAQIVEERRSADLFAMITTPFAKEVYDTPAAARAKMQEIADQYCAAKGESTCPFPVILQTLEAEAKREAKLAAEAAKSRFDKFSKLLGESPGLPGTPTQTNGKPAPTPTRSLSAQDVSTRRSSPKPAISEEEMEEAMLKAAQDALGPKKTTRTG